MRLERLLRCYRKPDNGGPTFTQALLPGSPAIDAGVAVPGVTTDQRGVPRPQGTAPDIGAFEAVGVPGARPPVVVDLRRSGVHRQPTHLVITFSTAVDPASAQDVHNYTLVRSGPAGRTGLRARPIPVASAVYDPTAQAVTLTPGRRLAPHGYYRLTASGAAPGGIKSATGRFLAGAGQPGTVKFPGILGLPHSRWCGCSGPVRRRSGPAPAVTRTPPGRTSAA